MQKTLELIQAEPGMFHATKQSMIKNCMMRNSSLTLREAAEQTILLKVRWSCVVQTNRLTSNKIITIPSPTGLHQS